MIPVLPNGTGGRIGTWTIQERTIRDVFRAILYEPS